MSIENNKAVVKRFLEGIWTYEKLASLDQFLTADYVFHDAIGETHGIAEFRAEVAKELEAFSNVLVTVDDMIGEGDRVAVRYTTSYVHRGEFMHAYPTGKLLTLHGTSIHRVVGDKVAETWEAYDRRTAARDVGAEQRLSDEDEAAIRDVVAETLRIGFADRPAIANLYWGEKAEVVAANGEAIYGRPAVLDWLQRFPPVSSWKLSPLSIDGAGEFAYVRGSYAIELSKRAKLPFDKGHYLEIWRKQSDGSWKVIRCAYTSELATRSRYRSAAASVGAQA